MGVRTFLAASAVVVCGLLVPVLTFKLAVVAVLLVAAMAVVGRGVVEAVERGEGDGGRER